MYDFTRIKLDTFWREPQNRIYLDDMYEPLPNAPIEIIVSFNKYKKQIKKIKTNISNYILKNRWNQFVSDWN